MITLSDIRKRNKRKNSFLNAKISNIKLSQEEFDKGRQVFSNFIEPINKKSLLMKDIKTNNKGLVLVSKDDEWINETEWDELYNEHLLNLQKQEDI